MTSKAVKKELVAALVMLVVMTLSITASTYAWFAMNAKATADNMRVTIASDASYLLISAGEKTAEQVQAERVMTASATATNAALLPAAHDIVLTNSAMAADANNWYYTYSDNPANSTGGALNGYDIAPEDFGKYVLVNRFSITVAQGSNPLEDLIVTDCAITSSSSDGAIAVKVIVATSEAAVEFDKDTTASSTSLAAVVTDSDVVPVDIYVYWNGNDQAVYTNNFDKLKDISVAITFTGTVREDE